MQNGKILCPFLSNIKDCFLVSEETDNKYWTNWTCSMPVPVVGENIQYTSNISTIKIHKTFDERVWARTLTSGHQMFFWHQGRMSGRKYSLASDSDVKFPWWMDLCVVFCVKWLYPLTGTEKNILAQGWSRGTRDHGERWGTERNWRRRGKGSQLSLKYS